MSILQRIRDYKVEEVAEARLRVPEEVLRDEIARADAPRNLEASLRTAMSVQGMAVIAEIKRASPTRGNLRPGLDPSVCAREYASGGGAALSVLTDGPSFWGSLDDMAAARAACELPVLRKDFVIDSYQLQEARAWSADGVLLIIEILDPNQASDLHAQATELGLCVVVEVHTASQLEAALSFDPRVIGVNNRDLHSFEADITTTVRLAADCPPDILVVSESGISNRDDLAYLVRHGVRACLIGEILMSQHDLAQALRDLILDLDKEKA